MFSTLSYSQSDNIWYSFLDNDEYLVGFKSVKGEIMIQPKFMGMTVAHKFDKVIAVMHELDSSNWDKYYLLKDGRIIGRDSVFSSDYQFDCESEGFIKFIDHTAELVGLFDQNGKVAIPAEYNALSKMRNGLIVGLKGAEKIYWDNDEHEHWSWTGGSEYLLDSAQTILVDDFKYNPNLDFYSMTISEKKPSEEHIVSYLGRNELFYSFVDNELLFTSFLFNELLPHISVDQLTSNTHNRIVYWKNNSWISELNNKFITDNYDLIATRLSFLLDDECQYTIFHEDFILTTQDTYSDFEKFKDNCGNLNTTKHPLFNVVITHSEADGFYQDHFNFLKTNDGFKLLSVTLRNATLE